MAKLKTNSGAKKRFTLTGSGKIKRKHAYHSHILTKKTKKRKRNLDHFAVLEKADYAIVVASGDEDGLMSGICANAGIPMDAIKSISDVTTALPAAFK